MGQKSASRPSRLQHPDHLAHCSAVVLDVLDHLVAEDEARNSGPGKGRCSPAALMISGERWPASAARSKSYSSPTTWPPYPDKCCTYIPTPQPFSRTAPLIRSPAAPQDHLQPALLARPPDVGWFASQRRLIEISIGHVDELYPSPLQLFAHYAKISAVVVVPILLTPRSGQPPLFCLYTDRWSS